MHQTVGVAALLVVVLASLAGAQCPSGLKSVLGSAAGYSFSSYQSSSNTKYPFTWYPCVPATSATAKCGNQNLNAAMMCQTLSTGFKSFGGNDPVKVTGSASAGYVFTSSLGQSCSNGPGYTSAVTLTCDSKSSDVTFSDSYKYTSSSCLAEFTASSSAGCVTSTSGGTSATGSSSGGPAPAKKKKEGLSVGSILCIVLLLVTVVYCAAGMAFQFKVRSARGLDLIPNRAFWGSLPGYIKDGFLFTFMKLRGKNYTALPN